MQLQFWKHFWKVCHCMVNLPMYILTMGEKMLMCGDACWPLKTTYHVS